MSLYEVEAVLGRKIGIEGHYEYRIKWKGYPLSKCTWEPEANLKFVQPLLNSYNATHPPNAHALPPPPPSPQPEHSSDQSPSSLEEEEPAGTVKEGVGRKGIQKKRGRKPKGQAGRAKKEDGRSAAKPTPPQSELKRPRGRPRKTPLPPSQELVFPAEESEEAEMPSELGYEVSGQRVEESRVNFLESEPQPMRNNVYDLEELSSQAMILQPRRQEVLQMARKGTDYIFMVGNQDEQKWMTRNDVLRDNALSLSLITFYETRMLFLDDPAPHPLRP